MFGCLCELTLNVSAVFAGESVDAGGVEGRI